MLKMMREKKYYVWDRKKNGSNWLRDIMFANSDSIKLLKKFSQVILFDGTYNTNQHSFPLIEIIGVAPTGNNYHIAFALLKSEVTESFEFLMTSMKDLYPYCESVDLSETKVPEVIITDLELAVMKAIHNVFSNAKHLLCHRHISQDVRKYVRIFFGKLQIGGLTPLDWTNMFSKSWNEMVFNSTEEACEDSLKKLEQDWSKYPSILEFACNTWFNPFRQRFVKAWTDDGTHYENTTTNW